MAIQEHNSPHPSPATELNLAFTPLVEALQAKIHDTHWLKRPETRHPRPKIITRRRLSINDVFPNHVAIFRNAPAVHEVRETGENRTPVLSVAEGVYGRWWTRRMLKAAHVLTVAALDTQSPVNIIPE